MAEQAGEGPAGSGKLAGEVRTLLAEVLVGHLAIVGNEGPYVVPISFAPGEQAVYFHGGPGHKADLLAADPRVCLAVTSPPELTKGADPCGDNFNYRSALLFGRARRLLDEEERLSGLRALAGKYHPEAAAAPFRPEVLARTLVYALDLDNVTWKTHPPD